MNEQTYSTSTNLGTKGLTLEALESAKKMIKPFKPKDLIVSYAIFDKIKEVAEFKNDSHLTYGTKIFILRNLKQTEAFQVPSRLLEKVNIERLNDVIPILRKIKKHSFESCIRVAIFLLDLEGRGERFSFCDTANADSMQRILDVQRLLSSLKKHIILE